MYFRQIAALIKYAIPKEKQTGTSSVLPASCNSGFSFHIHKNQPFGIAKCRNQSDEVSVTGSARTGGRVYFLLEILSSFLCCVFFGQIHLIAVKFFIHPQLQFVLQIAFYIESVLLIEVRKFFVPLMLGNVEFVAQKWPDTA